ncbi:MAG: Coenzyme PQQ synthesis protein E [Gammaproteobacteria bacterium]|nr:Coenzyme PQQ synthesis protein E [Gammaproteobacteria bacterium]
MGAAIAPPILVALNLTRRCNLACAHCYLDAGTRGHGTADELSTGEVKALLDRIADLSSEILVVLTGGEPLLRTDVCELAAHATRRGLAVVVGTNGTLLDDRRVRALQAAGVRALGISLDSLDANHHDRFRGHSGAWVRAVRGIDACRRNGLMFQIHFSVTDANAHELDAMIGFARSAGAAVLNVFFLVCTGRGASLSNVSAAVYERVLTRIAVAAREEKELLVRARCAPHFKRLAMTMAGADRGAAAPGLEAAGCLAGRRYCRVTPEGELTPCPYIEASAGSVRSAELADLWATAPLFAPLRAPALAGRCGACEYARVCGGCRARPYARDGNLMGEDFLCTYQPRGGEVIDPAADACLRPQLAWTARAEARLGHVPAFVRNFVRQRVESHARARGADVVTEHDLDELAKRRFGARPGHGVDLRREGSAQAGPEPRQGGGS